MLTMSTATVVLRKREEPRTETGVLHLSSSPSPGCDTYSESEYEPAPKTGLSTSFARRIAPKKSCTASHGKRHSCTYEGCSKSYFKPSRLAEHERSHTGNRPFICTTCNKSYLRESHLQAHSRSHLSYSDRPFICNEPGCSKRFWTTQHFRVHSGLHTGEKPFKCTEGSCNTSFMKHYQLREHVCAEHAAPGTKPYRCEHYGCTKSFATNQKLRTHAKTHDERRYTCSHTACLLNSETSSTYYATWTALQHHMRTAHLPACPYPACNGKTFSAQKGLRAHLKIHEQRDVEEKLAMNDSDAEDDPDEPPRKRRRGGEVGRDWICSVPDCEKDFKSRKALTTHHNVSHLGHRKFVCPNDSCRRAFGYKHILQRHLSKLHASGSQSSEAESSDDDHSYHSDPPQRAEMSIDDITGKAYSMRSRRLMTRTNILRCPYPNIHGLTKDVLSCGSQTSCEYVFSRAYDLRRHLQSEHSIAVEKEIVDTWVKEARRAKQAS